VNRTLSIGSRIQVQGKRESRISAASARIGQLGVLFALVFLAGHAEAGTISTFDSDAEGWTSIGFSNVNNYPLFPTPVTNSAVGVDYQASGGNPGGYISKMDPDGNWQYFSAPAAYLGNQSAAIGTNLTFDELIVNTFGQPALSPQGPLVAITDGTTTLVYGGGNILPPISGSSWNSLSVPLVASDWTVSTPAGAAASSAQFNSVMSNLSGVYILSDFWTGSGGNGEIVGLDNVDLAPVPLPAAAWLLLSGLGGLGILARRRVAA
jgi:hypothetical protein